MKIAFWKYNVGHQQRLSASHIIRNDLTLCGGHPVGTYDLTESDVLSCARCREMQGEKRKIGRRLFPKPTEAETVAAVAVFRNGGGLIVGLPDGKGKIRNRVNPTYRNQAWNARGAQ